MIETVSSDKVSNIEVIQLALIEFVTLLIRDVIDENEFVTFLMIETVICR